MNHWTHGVEKIQMPWNNANTTSMSESKISNLIDDYLYEEMFKILDEYALADMFSYTATGEISFISDPSIKIKIDSDGSEYDHIPGIYTELWGEIYPSKTLYEALNHLVESLFSNADYMN